jgi:radical SAM superfamily enzyme YgiQ (UPF0313 family)
MKAGFILASGESNYAPFRNQPLNALYLLTILEEEFMYIETELIDLRAVSLENAIYHIPEKDLYFYSVSSMDFLDIKKIVESIREVYPKAKHIAGGPHVNIFKEKNLEVFDTISIGEGEEAIKRIVRDYLSSDLKRVYLQEERIDLDSYPYPFRKYLPKSAAAERNVLTAKYRNLLGTDVLFSRGCPFACSFCANLTRGKTRVRSAKNITEEIMYLKKEYGIEGIVIKDDQAINIDKDIAKSMLEAIANTEIKWRGQSRANNVSESVIKLAKESGCLEIAVGIESVSPRVLKIINKRINLDEAERYFSLLRKEEIDIKLLLILGLPGEPKDIADRTIDFIKRTEPTNVLMSILYPMPGSEIYSNPKKFGIEIDQEYSEYKSLFGRFDPEELPKLTFKYEKTTPFGESMTNQEIIDNYVKVQNFLRENGMIF